MKETITIFTAKKARELLKKGIFTLVDIKDRPRWKENSICIQA